VTVIDFEMVVNAEAILVLRVYMPMMRGISSEMTTEWCTMVMDVDGSIRYRWRSVMARISPAKFLAG